MSFKAYYGDIHNHCGISYGHGSIEDAYENAKLQLDFASVTGHSSWHDIPKDDKHLATVVDYHKKGFSRLIKSWDHYNNVTAANNIPGRFVTFSSYEWHSLKYGDYVYYSKEAQRYMERPVSLEEWQAIILRNRGDAQDCFLIPHHISYKTGYRGINWSSFNGEISPVVEIISMHGCSESDDAPRSVLHTMGPRNMINTMQMGLERGNHFGVIGSSDHHSAHPGSYGQGLMGVWASSLTRDSIWQAIQERRTWALTGDKIELGFSINGEPLGSIIPYCNYREIEIFVKGSYSLDRVEIVKNNQILHRSNFIKRAIIHPGSPMCGKLFIEVGWGEKDVIQNWDVSVEISGGLINSIEPRFRGVDILEPRDEHPQKYRLTEWESINETSVHFKTVTRGNPTTVTNANQGISLEIEGTLETTIHLNVNGVEIQACLVDLIKGSRSHYLAGFLSGALHLHRFIPEEEYTEKIKYEDHSKESGSDFYYVRVAQKNDQWAWSSPIKVSGGI